MVRYMGVKVNNLHEIFKGIWNTETQEVDHEFLEGWFNDYSLHLPIIPAVEAVVRHHPKMIESKWEIMAVMLGEHCISLKKDYEGLSCLRSPSPVFAIKSSGVSEVVKRNPDSCGVLNLTDEENKEISALLGVPGINSIFLDISIESPSLIRYITSAGYHLTVSDYKVILLLHKKFNLEGI